MTHNKRGTMKGKDLVGNYREENNIEEKKSYR